MVYFWTAATNNHPVMLIQDVLAWKVIAAQQQREYSWPVAMKMLAIVEGWDLITKEVPMATKMVRELHLQKKMA